MKSMYGILNREPYYTLLLFIPWEFIKKFIGIKRKKTRETVVEALGEKYLKHILNHADVFWCEQIDEVANRCSLLSLRANL